MRILESGVSATIVVPDWPNRPWHVLLRRHAKRFRMLTWNENLPVMWGVCVGLSSMLEDASDKARLRVNALTAPSARQHFMKFMER